MVDSALVRRGQLIHFVNKESSARSFLNTVDQFLLEYVIGDRRTVDSYEWLFHAQPLHPLFMDNLRENFSAAPDFAGNENRLDFSFPSHTPAVFNYFVQLC